MKFSKIDKITGYHRGIPYSNSLFAWEDNYNIEFNNNMYYIKLKTHYSFIHSNFQFSLYFIKKTIQLPIVQTDILYIIHLVV